MNFSRKSLLFVIIISTLFAVLAFTQIQKEENILSHIVDLKKQSLSFYWKNDKGDNFVDFENLKQHLNTTSKRLVFAMNGGMYNKDLSPQGLFIENGVVKAKIDTIENGYGNFYLQPNGIFYITNNNEGAVCKTKDFKNTNVKFATQSGPLLLIDGKIHSKFRDGSINLHIRNGVGVMPNGKLVFAMSKQKMNFFDFANYFKSLGCKNALYLDGFVSRTYLPEKGYNSTEGNFGVIIGETKAAK